MENASKALIMAGAVLGTVILISIVLYAFNVVINNTKLEADVQSYSTQVEAFNRYFIYSSNDIDNNRSNGIQVKGSDAYNIIAKVNDINNNEWSLDEILVNGVSLNMAPNVSNFFVIDGAGNKTDSLVFTYEYKINPSTGLVNEVKLSGH